MTEFKAFSEIKQLSRMEFSITQKLHGTNAQVHIFPTDSGELDIEVGSRTRWLAPGKLTDNYGFAQFVMEHRQEFIDKLGVGRHFGEWCGPGINSGEGLTERTFVLFDWRRSYPLGLPPQCRLVPVLYEDHLSAVHVGATVDMCMHNLKERGSKLVPGFMRPEGIVVSINGVRYKKVFEAEETQWTKAGAHKSAKGPKEPNVDYTYLCQPIRLEKLLSRDEQLKLNYPQSLSQIIKEYVADLIKEGQIAGDEEQIKRITKAASSQIFKFVRSVMAGM